MESAIRFSQNSLPGKGDQRFMKVDVAGKSFSLCKISRQRKSTVEYEAVYTSTKVPTFRAFDWHPVNESIVAVGQSGGEATLLNIAEGQQDSISFSARQRLCNAVALNTQNLIAVGLDKVRTDFCLNIWDFNQRLPPTGVNGFSKAQTDPIHKLGSGEPITSLKFFQEQPQLLVAGMKGQFVRLYDLREPSIGNGLQFATRCVYNLAIDGMDESYFASCYPSNDPSICLWDRRMISRNPAAQAPLGGAARSDNSQPEVSLELKNVTDNPGAIWSLRFSKSQRGCLGVLSSTGHLKVYKLGKDFDPDEYRPDHNPLEEWRHSNPQEIYLDDTQDLSRPYFHPSVLQDEKQRIVSFDFMTSKSTNGQPQLITLSGNGNISTASLRPLPEPTAVSSTGFFCTGSTYVPAPIVDRSKSDIGGLVLQIRRKAEAKNRHRQAFKQAKKSSTGQTNGLDKMSNYAKQAWNADLGYHERDVPLPSLLTLLAQARLRCEEGYLLNPAINRSISSDSDWLQAFWSWLQRAERINKGGNMIQDNVDLSYVGVFGLWMEEVDLKARQAGTSNATISSVIKNLVERLNIPTGHMCVTEYPYNRKICLHVSGLAWSHEELTEYTKKWVAGKQHTRAAALSLFAGEEKLAQKLLRSPGAGQSHKMLAMALAGAQRGHRRSSNDSQKSATRIAAPPDSDLEDDWSATISSLSADLTDPYARAILAYVKSGRWEDVVAEESLPLKYRLAVALRHFDDSKLTKFVGTMKNEVINRGDVEGVILTGVGTKEGIELLAGYVRIFGDLQTAVLGLNIGGVSGRFLSSGNQQVSREIAILKDTYRASIMSWNLKFDKVKLDVALSRASKSGSDGGSAPSIRRKEQIRLVCAHCSQSISQFGHDQQIEDNSMKMTETIKNPLTSEKAAIVGTVCPRCGRHLPRCGVCDLWLGMPDESYSRWYNQQQPYSDKASGGVDLKSSMSGSAFTTSGPSAAETSISKDGTSKVTNSKSVASHIDSKKEGLNDDALIAEREAKWKEMMKAFTVFCVKCSHGFHAEHAKSWFEGSMGRKGHDVCPVPSCSCLCNG